MTFGKMFRVVLSTVIIVLIGCASARSQRTSDSAAVAAVALVTRGFIDAAAAEDVKLVYVRVRGANEQDVAQMVKHRHGQVMLIVGEHACELRDGRLRERRSDEPCYSIELDIQNMSVDFAMIRAAWVGSFGGIQVITFVVKHQHGKWAIAEERVGLIS